MCVCVFYSIEIEISKECEKSIMSVELIFVVKTEELIAVTLQHSFCLELMGLHPS